MLDHVIVVGAGIGGLSAAAALAPFCKHITVLDKDRLVDGVRKAIPQGAHIHILLRAGLQSLEHLLPGISDELEANGSVRIYLGRDQQTHEFGQWMPQRDLGVYFLSQSRPFLESVVRKRVMQLDNVTIRSGARVSQINVSMTDTQTKPSVELADGEHIAADAIVDAAGCSGPFIKKMDKSLGGLVRTDTFQSDIFYSTAHFKKVAPWDQQNENILIIPDPGHSSIGGSLLSVEGDRWCVSLHGRKGAKPPKDFAQWQEFAQYLPDQRIWDRIKNAPITHEIKTFRKPLSTWRRFDLCEKLPHGYLPAGDTFTSFNPIYGQGMTVALGHAFSLRQSLEQYSDDFNTMRSHYITRASKWSQFAWKRATTYDAYYSDSQEKASKLAIIKKMVLAQHIKVKDDAEFHLKIANQSQMLELLAQG